MKKRKRRKSMIMVPVASMADIAFLLIIFFMICSNFAKEGGIKLASPVAPDISTLPQSLVSVSVDENGNVFLQGTRVGGARDVEAGVAALLHGRTDEKDRVVLFKCDRDIDREVYEPVIGAITRGGGIVGAVGEKGNPRR